MLNSALKTLLGAHSLIYFSGALLGPIYAVFVERIGGDILAASSAWAVFAISTAVFMFLFGRIDDKLSHPSRVMALGYLLLGASYFGYLLVKVPWHLFLVQVLIGIAEALYAPAHDLLYSRHLDKNLFGTEWGIWEMTVRVALGLGALAGGLIVTWFGFGLLFVVMGILSVLAAAYVYWQPVKLL